MKKATHYCPSGLGGVFSVCVLEDNGETLKVKVINKQSDFHGKVFSEKRSNLEAIEFHDAVLRYKNMPLGPKPVACSSCNGFGCVVCNHKGLGT